jgi:hypothetical protein
MKKSEGGGIIEPGEGSAPYAIEEPAPDGAVALEPGNIIGLSIII